MGRKVSPASTQFAMFQREASLATRNFFGNGTYDLNDPKSLRQLGSLCMMAVVMFLCLLWVDSPSLAVHTPFATLLAGTANVR